MDYKDKIREMLKDTTIPPEQREKLEEILLTSEEIEDKRLKEFLHKTFTKQYLCADKLGKWHGEPVANILTWIEKQCQVKESTEIQHDNKTCKENDDSLTSYDERIGKDIISFLRSKNGYMTPNEDWDFHNRWLPWLEKQCEKPQGKPALEAIKEKKADNANKVERKFKVEEGKYYVCIRNLDDRYGTRAFRKGVVYYSPKNGSLEPDNSNVPSVISCAEHYFRPWTVEDAKEGDVLYSPNLKLLWIYKSRDTVYCGCNLNYNDGAICGEGYFQMPTDAIPATKEQVTLFFQKMKEAGCRWNPTEKKLEKIDSGKESESKKEERTYSTEECNCIIQDTISICEQARKNATNEIDYENVTRCIGWLKILKYRHTWKPSKEQMDTLLFISSVLKDEQVIVNLEELKTLYNELKKL